MLKVGKVLAGPFARVLVWLLASVPMAAAQFAEPSPQLKALEAASAAHYMAGAYHEALEVSEKVLALTAAEFGPEHERVGIQTYGRGLVAEAAGELGVAERAFRDSLRIRNKVYGVDSAGTAQAMEKLGGVLLRTGRLDEAEALFLRVLKIRTDLVGTDHSFTAGARADLGAVGLARGDPTAALGHYREAVRLLTTQRSAQTLAKAVMDEEIRRSRDAFAGLSLAAWQTSQLPNGDRPGAAAESYAASQQAWATSAGAALARMSARLGTADTGLGRGIRALQDKSERVLALGAEDMQALGEWSAVQRANPAYAAALDAFRQASIANARDNAPTLSRQKALVEQLQAQFKRCPPGQKSSGCENGERERETITRELSALSAQSSKGNGNLTALSQRLQAAEQLLPGHTAFATRRSARLDESQRLERAITEERAAIIKAFPDYVALTEPSPLAIPQTQTLLLPDEALVTILVGTDKSFVWAISRERAEWSVIEAGADALAGHVAAVRRGLDSDGSDDPGTAGAVTPSFDVARAHALYLLVLGPVATVLAGKSHVLVVPTGPLSSLPFQVLVTEQPQPAAGTTMQDLRSVAWLIRRHALSVLPSVQSLAALRKLTPANAAAKPFLGVGDPVLTGPSGGSQQPRGSALIANRPASVYRNGRADLRAMRELAPLPETAQELRLVARALGAPSDAVLLGAEATETRIKQTRLEDYRVIQFATHGLVGGELSSLDEPALVLTPPETATEQDDGLLTASEVAALRLNAEWVVLSACNTASGTTAGADALSGFARAFFYAGARGLLVSHWAVDSQATVFLTTQTFTLLAANPKLGRAEALRRSMLAMIEAGQPPANWAPFVLVGEGAGR